MSKILKEMLLFYLGGTIYYFIEIAYRGFSHWSMILLAGFCVVFLIDPINNVISWNMDYRLQVAISTVLCTIAEGVCGLIVNRTLNLGIWDYSQLWGSFFYDQCNVIFVIAWAIVIAFIAIPLADGYDYYICQGEQRPYYRIGKRKITMPKR